MGRAVIDGDDLPERLVELATMVVEALLQAGLPPYDMDAAADGEETGVVLAKRS